MVTPKLRFKEFAGNWCISPLKNLCKINQGLQIAIEDRFLEDGENRFFYITNEFLREGAKKSYFIENPPISVRCKLEDILMTRTGNTGQVVTNVEGAFHNNFFKIDFDREQIDKNFFVEFLRKNTTQHLILKYAGASTIPDLNHSDFYRIQMPITSIEEQTKIASFLSAVDEKISQLTQKHELLSQYKQGMMQKLFSQQIRFKADDGSEFDEWEELPLSQLSEKAMYGMNASATEYDGLNKYLRITDICERSNKFKFDNLTSPNAILEEKYKLNYGDLLFARTGASVGKSYLYSVKDGDTYFAGFLIKFSLKLQVVHPYFIFVQTLTKDFDKWIVTNSMRSGQPGINAEEYSGYIFQVPCLEEQTKIANFLSSIDQKIEVVAQQIEQAKQWKKGLLQQMFV